MPKYKVVDGHKKINGKLRAPGDIVECSEETAAQLRLEPVKEEKKPATAKDIIEMIGAMTVPAEIKKYLEDERITVSDAAEKRLKELKG